MLPTIQALRALAAYLVVLLHLSSLTVMAGASDDLFGFGNSGVDLFFVISGFIMVFTTARRETKPWNFFGSRIARVVPFYWLVTLTVFTVAVLAPSLLQATRGDPVQLLKSLLFIPFRKDNGLAQPIVFVGWTLNYEMFFYTIFATCLFIRNRIAGLTVNLIALIGLVAAAIIVRPQQLEFQFFADPILLEFAMGMILGIAYPYLPQSMPRRWPVVLLACLALGALIGARLVWPEEHRVLVFGLPAFVIVFSALLLDRAGVGIRSKLLLTLGNASYSIYLTHFFVTQTMVKLAQKLHLESLPALGLCYVAALIGVALVGLIVHVAIEKRLAEAARKWINLAKSPTVPAAGLSGADVR